MATSSSTAASGLGGADGRQQAVVGTGAVREWGGEAVGSPRCPPPAQGRVRPAAHRPRGEGSARLPTTRAGKSLEAEAVKRFLSYLDSPAPQQFLMDNGKDVLRLALQLHLHFATENKAM